MKIENVISLHVYLYSVIYSIYLIQVFDYHLNPTKEGTIAERLSFRYPIIYRKAQVQVSYIYNCYSKNQKHDSIALFDQTHKRIILNGKFESSINKITRLKTKFILFVCPLIASEY